MELLIRFRWFIVRHRGVYWAFIAGVSVFVATSIGAEHSRLRNEREAWGASREVWVTTAAAQPGDVVTVEMRRLPLAAVPDLAVTKSPTGLISRQRLTDGEVVTEVDVGSGVEDLLPPDHRGVAVPVGRGGMTVAVGAVIDVASLDRIVATDCIVISVDDETVVIAVPADDAAAVAAAANDGTAELLLAPSSDLSG